METVSVGKVTFELREQQDFSWLLDIGEPFCVFGQNDSGNISFGVEQGGRRYFVKYAGARTAEYGGEPEQAVENLRGALQVYRDLPHPHVIRLLREVETPRGLAAVFDWAEGDCLYAHWTFDRWDRHTHPESPYVKFRALPLAEKRKAADVLFDFLAYAEERGYAAVDFYDGSILYDFETGTVTICDIDFFRKKPVVNDLGEQWWGSRRLKAPEEYELGAEIGSDTNVFGLGRLLLCLLAGEEHPDREHWEDTEARWQAVQRAVRSAREERFPSIWNFWEAWKRGGPDLGPVTVREVKEGREKRETARAVLEALPGWFGVPGSREEYIWKSGSQPFAAAFRGERPIGFLALRKTSPYAAELMVLGVLPEEHRSGAGRKLVEWALEKCREQGAEFLQVKTLDESAYSPGYARTRAFYRAMGFRELEVLPTLWDRTSPCLLMVRTVCETPGR